MATVSVRYIVDDVAAAIGFYCDRLAFTEVMHPAPTFAMLSRGDLRLVLSAPEAARVAVRRCRTERGRDRAAGNRFAIEVEDLRRQSRNFAWPACASATKSSAASAVGRSLPSTHPAIQSSSSSPPTRIPKL
jgi:catechol 2,3-dioxygenase-like lactoylglutathione lyase family enzyme